MKASARKAVAIDGSERRIALIMPTTVKVMDNKSL